MAKLSKKQRMLRDAVQRDQLYTLEDAVRLIKEHKSSKFDETLEISLNLGIDPRHADQQVRGSVVLPHGTGKSVRVAVFARNEKADEAKEAGADIVGAEDLMETIMKGDIHFDRCIATPDMMAVVGRLGKILGPKNLMPNPKLGTVTTNVAEAIKAAKSGDIQYRAEKNGIVHAGVGRSSFDEKALIENLKFFIKAISQSRPSGAKGTFIKKVSISSTQGPGIKIDYQDVV